MKHILISIILAILPLSTVYAQNADKTIIIISDLHMCDARSCNEDKYYASTDKKRSVINAFMQKLNNEQNDWDELILNGDIFELWRVPYDMHMLADEDGNVITKAEYLKLIEKNNQPAFDILREMKEAGKTIVYLPGNHDVSVTDNDIKTAFGDLFTTSYDCIGNGLYEPFGKNTAVAIEHGSRYEYFNAAYLPAEFGVPVDNDCIIAPGFFTTRMGASATVYKEQKSNASKYVSANITSTETEDTDAGNRTLLASMWNAIRAGAGSPSYDVIVDFGGTFGQTARWSDYAVSETNNPTLFPDSWTVENWEKRCKMNNVPVYVPFGQSLLSAEFHDPYFNDLAFTERLQNHDLPTLICVWGHSHKKKMITRHDDVKGDVIYLNEGAWEDGTDICTYGKIAYTAENHQYKVQIHSFDADGIDETIESKYLYVPENNASQQIDGTWKFNVKAKLLEDEADGIENIRFDSKTQNTYNINGQRVSPNMRGIVISNGKKWKVES